MDAGRLVGWLRGRCRQLGLEASEEALELLAERTEGNLLAAHQELSKLALLAGSGPVDLALAESALTGLLAWLESAPPGSHLDVIP